MTSSTTITNAIRSKIGMQAAGFRVEGNSMYVKCVLATCEVGFGGYFPRVLPACMSSIAAAEQPISPKNSLKTVDKTVLTCCISGTRSFSPV